MILSGASTVAGVIGWPVSHSRSPRLHGYWLELLDIDGAYVPLAVPPDKIEVALAALPAMGLCGVNVTVPHKTAAATACTRLDAAASAMGAVNTIVVTDDGELNGSNTDGVGFLENLKQGAGWTGGGKAVVLGAGGAARAVLWALLEAGAEEVVVVNRTASRAESLVAEFSGPVSVRPWNDRGLVLADASLLVNTTSLGMQGADPLDLDLDRLPPDTIVNDIVYVPLETDLLRRARMRGNRTVDGLGMLIHQAVPGFAAWFGVEPPVNEDVRAFVLDGLA